MNPSTEVKTPTSLHTIQLGYSGASTDQERWAYLSSLRAFLSPCGQVGFTDNVTTTAASSTPAKIEGVTAAGVLSGFTASNGRLTLTAPDARVVVTAGVSLSDGNNNVISLYIAKNGAVVPSSKSTHTIDVSSHHAQIVSHALIDLVAGDYLEAFIANETIPSSVLVSQFTLLAK